MASKVQTLPQLLMLFVKSESITLAVKAVDFLVSSF